MPQPSRVVVVPVGEDDRVDSAQVDPHGRGVIQERGRIAGVEQ
jgi:hypothetical protein